MPTTTNSCSVDLKRWRELDVPPSLGEPATRLAEAYVRLGCEPSFTCAPYLRADAPREGAQLGYSESNAVVYLRRADRQKTDRGDAATATWIFRGDASRRPPGLDLETSWRRVAVTPRLRRRSSVEASRGVTTSIESARGRVARLRYANSVLGARTQKYADYMDACVALTGRAPRAGAHVDTERRATVAFDCAELVSLDGTDDAFWAALGYVAGARAGPRVPALLGFERAPRIGFDDLKSFAAAFGTTASAPLFHVPGQTPCVGMGDLPEVSEALSPANLEACWRDLGDGPANETVDLIALGSPHASSAELERLAGLVSNRKKNPNVRVVVTLSAETLASSPAVSALRDFGVDFVADTCWCMLNDPVVPPSPHALLTNSAKYAHYAPGLVGRRPRLAGLAACADAAVAGRVLGAAPRWASGGARRALWVLRRVAGR